MHKNARKYAISGKITQNFCHEEA